jgi:hypothetical protein
MSTHPDPNYQPPNAPAYEREREIYNDQTVPTSAQVQRETYNTAPSEQVQSDSQYVEDRNLSRANMRYWIATTVYFLLGVLVAILLLRFVFRMLAANPDNSFVMFLYSLSGVFVAPFNGIFNDQALGRGSVFEISTLVAMLIYALIAWGLIALGRVVFSPSLDDERHVTTRRRRRAF